MLYNFNVTAEEANLISRLLAQIPAEQTRLFTNLKLQAMAQEKAAQESAAVAAEQLSPQEASPLEASHTDAEVHPFDACETDSHPPSDQSPLPTPPHPSESPASV